MQCVRRPRRDASRASRREARSGDPLSGSVRDSRHAPDSPPARVVVLVVVVADHRVGSEGHGPLAVRRFGSASPGPPAWARSSTGLRERKASAHRPGVAPRPPPAGRRPGRRACAPRRRLAGPLARLSAPPRPGLPGASSARGSECERRCLRPWPCSSLPERGRRVLAPRVLSSSGRGDRSGSGSSPAAARSRGGGDRRDEDRCTSEERRYLD